MARVVLDYFGGNLLELVSATWKLNDTDPGRTSVSGRTSLPERLKDTLQQIWATPWPRWRKP